MFSFRFPMFSSINISKLWCRSWSIDWLPELPKELTDSLIFQNHLKKLVSPAKICELAKNLQNFNVLLDNFTWKDKSIESDLISLIFGAAVSLWMSLHLQNWLQWFGQSSFSIEHDLKVNTAWLIVKNGRWNKFSPKFPEDHLHPTDLLQKQRYHPLCPCGKVDPLGSFISATKSVGCSVATKTLALILPSWRMGLAKEQMGRTHGQPLYINLEKSCTPQWQKAFPKRNRVVQTMCWVQLLLSWHVNCKGQGSHENRFPQPKVVPFINS